jgi:hypothetical protein
MIPLLISLVLAQSQPAVRRSTPLVDDPGMVVRQIGTVNVNCVGCSSGSAVTIDGGYLTAYQGPGRDGGPWEVYVVNPSGGSSTGWVPDGGFIGTVQLVDSGVYVLNFPATWFPDGGSIGSVTVSNTVGVNLVDAGVVVLNQYAGQAYIGIDGGQVTALQGGAPWSVYLADASVNLTGPIAVTQNGGQDGGAWNVSVNNLQYWTPDGGSLGTVNVSNFDGGVFITSGTVNVGNFDGGVFITSGTVTMGNFDGGVWLANWGAMPTPGLTDTQLRASPINMVQTNFDGGVFVTSGYVNASNFDGGVWLSNWSANPALTDTQLRATPINAVVTNYDAGVWIANWGAMPTPGLTDAQLRATALYVIVLDGGSSGSVASTVTQGPGYDGGTDWGVYCSNCTGGSGGGWTPDGGFIGSVTLNGAVDPNNTTSVALGGGATFTGIATDLTNFAQIVGWAYANVASATNGMCVQFSSDATNWDTYSCRTLPAGATAVEGIPVMGRYFRFVYTNGAAAQTTFRLQSTMKTVPLTGTIGDIDVVPSTGSHSLYTQSVIVGKTTAGGGAYVPVKVNPSGALTAEVTQASFPWLVAGSDGGKLSVDAVIQFDGGYVTTNGLTDTQLRATPVNVTVTNYDAGVFVTNFPALQNVVVTNYDGGVFATQGGTWTVRTQDGTGNALAAVTAPVNGTATNALTVTTVKKFAAAPVTTSVTCGTGATLLPTTAATNRSSACFYNNGGNTIFIGTSTVTTGNGFPVIKGAAWCDDIGSQVYYCIVAASAENMRVLEN